MPRRILPLLMLALSGCPATAPDSRHFATDLATPGVDAPSAALDLGAAAEDAVDAAADLTDLAPQPPADVEVADVSAYDAAGAKGACAKGPGLFAKNYATGSGAAAYGIAALDGGSSLLVGDSGTLNKTDLLLMQIGPFGAITWAKTFGGSDEEHGRGILALADGAAAVGSTRSKGAGYGDGWLVRTDLDGALLWDKTYGGSGDDALYGIAAAGDGFILVGSNRSLGGGLEDGWLVRTDAAGTVLWEDNYGGSSIDQLFAVVALPSGGFAAAGVNNSISVSGSDAWLLLVDAKGKQIGEKAYSYGETDDAKALRRLGDGSFVLTGVASNKGNPDLWVLRTDADGNLLWKDVVGGNQSETGRGVTAFVDGSFAVVGDSNSPPSSGSDGWLLRYDAWGNRLWDQRFGGSANQWFYAIQALTDGGLLIGGRFYDGANSANAWLLRTNAWAQSDCAQAGPCKGKLSNDCDDANTCTIDGCDNISGCTHAALPFGAVCGAGKACGTSACIGG